MKTLDVRGNNYRIKPQITLFASIFSYISLQTPNPKIDF